MAFLVLRVGRMPRRCAATPYIFFVSVQHFKVNLGGGKNPAVSRASSNESSQY